MKKYTYKYSRILDAQCTIIKKIKKLELNKFENRNKIEKLNAKYNEYEAILKELTLEITQTEFELYLQERMCCTWEEFKQY